MMKTLNEYRQDDFEFEGYSAKVVIPDTPDEKRHMALKTEYYGAFPNTEEALLEKGFHLAYIKNKTRWCIDEDLDRKHRFVRFVAEKYGLDPRCVPVGMSCGGQIAVKFAAKYPEDVSVLYLDAPVLNYLSCPFHLDGSDPNMATEFVNATGLTLVDMINYREHPIDFVPTLLEHHFPIILVCGECDKTVTFANNGLELFKRYKAGGGNIRLILKPGCDHHPHGLADPKEIVDFILDNV